MADIQNCKEYVRPLGDGERLRVRVDTQPTGPPSYCFQVEVWFDDARGWEPVVRADDFHDHPHLDLVSPSGKQRKLWFRNQGDCKANMKAAQSWMGSNWEAQIERYRHELYEP